MHLIPASWAHLHILVSIFPSVGLIFVVGVYVAGLVANSELTKRISLYLIAALGLLAIPTYISGMASMSGFVGNADFSQEMVNAHYVWGIVASIALLAAAAAAGFELYKTRRAQILSGQMGYIILVLALVALSLVVLVDENGWAISHREFALETPGGGTSQAWSNIHVILNHFPTAGFVLGLAFYIVALVANHEFLKRAALTIFAIGAVLTAPTYVTGAAAMWALTEPQYGDVSMAAINAHRDFALLTLFGVAFTGGIAWVQLWLCRHTGKLSNGMLYAVLAFAVLTLIIMAETGHRGGLINHPEIRTAADVFPEDPVAGFWSPAIERSINQIKWFVPWQTLHFFGYSILFGAVLIVTLRVLGFWKSLPFSSVHRVLPFAFFGLMLNVFSGMLIMMADTFRYVNNTTFAPKIALLAIGGMAALYFSMSDELWKVKAGESASLSAKLVAMLVLLSWTGVIMGGRLLPYL
jgi:uncharacterized membrane protein